MAAYRGRNACGPCRYTHVNATAITPTITHTSSIPRLMVERIA